MDDTAFHYSRTLRIIVIMAIVIPILVIGAILWYFSGNHDSYTPHDTGGAHVVTAP